MQPVKRPIWWAIGELLSPSESCHEKIVHCREMATQERHDATTATRIQFTPTIFGGVQNIAPKLLAFRKAILRQADVVTQMQKVVREDGQLGAPGRGKDDRVIAAGLAHVAWADFVRNQCIQRGMLRPKEGARGDLETVKPIIAPTMKGWLQKIGIES